MTLEQIDEILAGRFAIEEERQYWEQRRAEVIRKMKTAKETERYLRLMRVYDR